MFFRSEPASINLRLITLETSCNYSCFWSVSGVVLLRVCPNLVPRAMHVRGRARHPRPLVWSNRFGVRHISELS
jgi:hypothetical protein